MSTFLNFRKLVRAKNWEAANDLMVANAWLSIKTDAKGRALASYSAEDGRWDEVRWLLRHGGAWEQALAGFCRSRVPAPADIELFLSNQFMTVGMAATKDKSDILESAIKTGKKDWVRRLLNGKLLLDEAGWSRAWFCALTHFDEDICVAMRESEDFGVLMKISVDVALKAVRYGKLNAIGWLTQEGLDLNGHGENGFTLLGLAAKLSKNVVLEWLIGVGADVDGFDGRGHTALYYAVASGHADVVGILVNAGAVADLRQGLNSQGDSPLRLATKAGARLVRQALLPSMEESVLRSNLTTSPVPRSSKESVRRL